MRVSSSADFFVEKVRMLPSGRLGLTPKQKGVVFDVRRGRSPRPRSPSHHGVHDLEATVLIALLSSLLVFTCCKLWLVSEAHDNLWSNFKVLTMFSMVFLEYQTLNQGQNRQEKKSCRR